MTAEERAVLDAAREYRRASRVIETRPPTEPTPTEPHWTAYTAAWLALLAAVDAYEAGL